MAFGLSTEAVQTDPARTVVRFSVDVNELETECMKSPDFELNSIFWTVELCKSSDFVNATLVSFLAEDANSKWSCSAEATIKLRSPVHDESGKKIEKKIEKQSFNIHNLTNGLNEIVEWNDLLANYVYENETYVEIEIAVDPPVRSKQTETGASLFIIYVENVSNLTAPYFSPDFVVRGIRWNVEIKRESTDHLGIYLHASKEDLVGNESWVVTVSFELISWRLKTPSDNVQRIMMQRFGKDETWGYQKFVEWNKLMDPKNELIKDDIAWFNVHLQVDHPKLGWVFK